MQQNPNDELRVGNPPNFPTREIPPFLTILVGDLIRKNLSLFFYPFSESTYFIQTCFEINLTLR